MNAVMKIGLLLCIAIVYPFMIGFGIESFYPPPKQAYEVCRSVDPNNMIKPGETKSIIDPLNDAKYNTCYEEAQAKLDIHSRNLFLVATALGFIAIILGTLLFSEKIGPVGPGLVFGGLFTILYGTMRSFRSLDKLWIFIELVIVFIGIIIVTWRYVRSVGTKTKKKK